MTLCGNILIDEIKQNQKTVYLKSKSLNISMYFAYLACICVAVYVLVNARRL